MPRKDLTYSPYIGGNGLPKDVGLHPGSKPLSAHPHDLVRSYRPRPVTSDELHQARARGVIEYQERVNNEQARSNARANQYFRQRNRGH